MAAARKSATAGKTKAEAAQELAEYIADEKGAALANRQRVARTYVQAKHPDTGLAVTFVPGEALPEWVKLKDGDEA